MKSSKKKFDTGKQSVNLPPGLNPLIVVNENECLFWIVEFTIPGVNEVLRFISKRTTGGKIHAVTYVGVLATDGVLYQKVDIKRKVFATEKDFIKEMRIVHLLFRMKGGISRILNLDGMTLSQASEAIKRNDWGTVSSPEEFLKYAGNRGDGLLQ